jgi:hypothetical protein
MAPNFARPRGASGKSLESHFPVAPPIGSNYSKILRATFQNPPFDFSHRKIFSGCEIMNQKFVLDKQSPIAMVRSQWSGMAWGQESQESQHAGIKVGRWEEMKQVASAHSRGRASAQCIPRRSLGTSTRPSPATAFCPLLQAPSVGKTADVNRLKFDVNAT